MSEPPVCLFRMHSSGHTYNKIKQRQKYYENIENESHMLEIVITNKNCLITWIYFLIKHESCRKAEIFIVNMTGQKM